MNYRQMGQAGLKLSEVSLGAWLIFGAQINEPFAAPAPCRLGMIGTEFQAFGIIEVENGGEGVADLNQ